MMLLPSSRTFVAVNVFLSLSIIILVIYCGSMSVLFYDSIQALLSAPNPDDPLSENIAKHWKTNEAEAVETGE